MSQDSHILPGLSPVQGRLVQASFDGGMISSNGGLLLREVERGTRNPTVSVLAQLAEALGVTAATLLEPSA